MYYAEVRLNESWEPQHSIAIDQDNYNVSRSCDFVMNNMSHIHNSHEFLFVEEGSAYYYIGGKPYFLEPGDILAIGAMDYHKRIIDSLPFKRYGLTLKPAYCKSLHLDNDLAQLFATPSAEMYSRHYKAIDPETFNCLIDLLRALKGEQLRFQPHRAHMERSIVTQVAVVLFRIFQLKQKDMPLSAAHILMLDIKEYIDLHYKEVLDLKSLSELFYCHPSTISKDFRKYCGHNLNRYINMVRISEAAKILENSNHSICFVAEQCGYTNENTFLRQFKNILGNSPSQYRKAYHELYK